LRTAYFRRSNPTGQGFFNPFLSAFIGVHRRLTLFLVILTGFPKPEPPMNADERR
jgi:hypothetical protein